MTQTIRYFILLTIGVLLLVTGCTPSDSSSSQNIGTETNRATAESGSQTTRDASIKSAGDSIFVEGEVQSQWDPNGIDDFSLTERSGKTITKQDLLGHHWAVAFTFTRCAGTCPKITDQLRKLQERFKGTDIKLVSITVDPDYDTPEKLKRYADFFQADPAQWYFLTGDKHDVFGLIIKSFRMPVKEMEGKDRKPGYEVLHSNNIIHVDDDGKVVKKYNGLLDSDMIGLRKALEKVAKPLEMTESNSEPSDDVSENREDAQTKSAPLKAPLPTDGERPAEEGQ